MKDSFLKLAMVIAVGFVVFLTVSCGGAGPAALGSPTLPPSSASTAAPTTLAAQGEIQGLVPSAPWSDGERSVYNADQKGQSIGTMEISLAKQTFGWTITEVDALSPLSQTIQMRVDSTLKPLGETKISKAPQTDLTLNTEYKDSKLTIKAKVNGEDRQATIDVPPASLDNDQLLVTLRALDFHSGLETKLTTIVANSASKVPTTVRVQSKETVTVPAGSFETWKTELDFGPSKQYCWYQVNSPHQLIKYDNGAVTMVLAAKPK